MAGSIYLWSTTAANNGTVDPDVPWPEGMARRQVNDSARGIMGRVAEWVGDQGGALTAGGTANALTVTANSGFTSYADGQRLTMKASAVNTGAATLNVNAIGTKAIRKFTTSGDAALVGGEIQDDGVYEFVYSGDANSAAGGWLLLNPTLGASNITISNNAPAITWDQTDGTSVLAQNNGNSLLFSTVGAGTALLRIDHAVNTVLMSGDRVAITGDGTDIAAFGSGSASGSIRLRPNAGSDGSGTSGQVIILTSGEVQLSGQLTATNGADFGTGNVDFSDFSSSGASAGKQVTSNGLINSSRSTAGAALHMQFFNPNGAVGNISTTGSSTVYGTSSDERLKDFTGLYDAAEAIRIIRADPVRTFNWKSDGQAAIGWGAQTSHGISPDLANPGEGDAPWTVDKGARTPYLWAAMANVLDRLEAAGL